MTEYGPSTVSTSITVTGTTDEVCPCCGTTTGVRHTSDTGRVQAWACDCCTTEWAFTVIRPDSRAAVLLTDLGAAVEEIGRLRWTLAQIIAVADQAPGLTDVELRDRLLALAESGCPVSPAPPGGGAGPAPGGIDVEIIGID